MNKKEDNPGVHFPPPLIYIAVFILSIVIQSYIPLSKGYYESSLHAYLSIIFVGIGFLSLFPAMFTFFKTKNAFVPSKPATSLQANGIYSISRNPMYVGLMFLYVGMGMIQGNLWTFILIPLVIYGVNRFVIINEEKYLERAFGEDYLSYKTKVRRWL